MDPELRRLLEETRALAKDNHSMLRAIRRGQWLSFFGKIIFWAVLLLLPFYFYQQYIQPTIEKFSTAPATAASNILGLPSSADIQKLIDSYKAGQ